MLVLLVWVAIALSAVAIALATVAVVLTAKNYRASNPRVRLTNVVIDRTGYGARVNFDVVNSGRTATTLYRERAIHKHLRGFPRSGKVTARRDYLPREWHKAGRVVEAAASVPVRIDLDALSYFVRRPSFSEETPFARRLRPLLARRVRVELTLGNGAKVRSTWRQSVTVRDVLDVVVHVDLQRKLKDASRPQPGS